MRDEAGYLGMPIAASDVGIADMQQYLQLSRP
jgi:hypothetical protein